MRVGRGRSLAIALLVLLVSMLAGVLVGAVGLPVGGVARSLLDHLPGVRIDSGLSSVQEAVLWQIRLPRVVLAAMVGGMLAMAGAAYQGVFRNPLVDPYLLGAAAGAGLGATLVLAFAPDGVNGIGVLPAAGFVGAMAGVMLSYSLGMAAGRETSTATLVLAGVAVTAFLTAVQTFVLQQRSDVLRSVYSWILGQLGRTDWSGVAGVAPYMAVSTVVVLLHARLLDVMAVGDDKSSSLGVRTGRVRLTVVMAASLGTAAAVAVGGLISFVGIIVPHVVRRLVGGGNRIVVPVSLVIGGAFLVLCDTAARTVLSPAELPVGVVTAFIGAPFFAALLCLQGRRS